MVWLPSKWEYLFFQVQIIFISINENLRIWKVIFEGWICIFAFVSFDRKLRFSTTFANFTILMFAVLFFWLSSHISSFKKYVKPNVILKLPFANHFAQFVVYITSSCRYRILFILFSWIIQSDISHSVLTDFIDNAHAPSTNAVKYDR